MVDLRVDPAGPARRSAPMLGVELPTTRPPRPARHTVIWLGPDEWLVTARA